VSIHANAHPRAVSEGVETYFLSSEASDSDARQVAAVENGVVQLEGPAARAKGDLLKTVLWDLAQSEFSSRSGLCAGSLSPRPLVRQEGTPADFLYSLLGGEPKGPRWWSAHELLAGVTAPEASRPSGRWPGYSQSPIDENSPAA